MSRVQPRLRGAVGATLSGRAIGRAVQPAPWSEAVSVHAERGGEDPQRHAQAADRWQHALEHTPLGGHAGSVAHDGARVWNKHRLLPHRLERYMSSNDPDFEQKAADIIGLYLNPPARAAVFCVDEKTAIQALDCNDPVLPLSPGRAERHGFEYYRHGTLALYAACNTKPGDVIGKTVARHTSEQFVAFLSEIVAHQPAGQEIHVIAANLSAHTTKRVQAFLS